MPVSLSQQYIAAAKATPAGLASVASNGAYQLPPHLILLNFKLWQLGTGQIKRLIVEMPPRHGKSELCSKYFPAWLIGALHLPVILTSYEATFAASWGRKARDILAEWGPSLYGVRLSDSSAATDWWELAGDTGGSMMTAGVGGPITGKGGNVLIDDPIKNAEEAASPTFREKIWDWFQSTAYTRLEPDGFVLLVMTRWHDDDLAGRLLKAAENGEGDQWEVIRLPAIAEADECIPLADGYSYRREAGQPLWPERFSLERLEEIHTAVGGMVWSALYQQQPVIEGGVIFKREWLDARYKELPLAPHERIERVPTIPGAPRAESKERLSEIVLAVDGAWKTGVANDYSVIAVWGRTATHYYLLDIWRDKVELPSLLRAIEDMALTWKPTAIIIEDEASGIAAIQALRNASRLPVLPFQPTGSKQARAASVSPLFEAGRVLLPDAALAPWLAAWIEEHVRFPRAPHDDQVDTTSMALERLRGNGRRGSAWGF